MATPWIDGVVPGSWAEMRAMLQRHTFIPPSATNQPWTASEVEIYATSPDGELVHGPEAPIHQIDRQRFPRARLDFMDYMWEASPLVELGQHDDWRTADEVRRGIVMVYDELLTASDTVGAQLTSIADGDCWDAVRTGHNIRPNSARYRWITEHALPSIYVGATSIGFQTHLRNPRPLDDQYFQAIRGVTQFLPLLLAASANSFHPTKHVASMRYFHFKSLGSCGVFGWHTLADFMCTLETWFEDGRLQGPHDWHPWVKPCRGSTEVRVCDTPGSVLDAIALHAVSHALMEWQFRSVEAGEVAYNMEPPRHTQRLTHAFDQAARHGVSNLNIRIPSPLGPGVESLETLYQRFADLLAPVMDQLGYQDEHRHFFHEMVGNRQTGAERQKQWRAEGYSTREILDADNAFLRATLEDAKKRLGREERSVAA